jgi:hypothetical protein
MLWPPNSTPAAKGNDNNTFATNCIPQGSNPAIHGINPAIAGMENQI